MVVTLLRLSQASTHDHCVACKHFTHLLPFRLEHQLSPVWLKQTALECHFGVALLVSRLEDSHDTGPTNGLQAGVV